MIFKMPIKISVSQGWMKCSTAVVSCKKPRLVLVKVHLGHFYTYQKLLDTSAFSATAQTSQQQVVYHFVIVLFAQSCS